VPAEKTTAIVLRVIDFSETSCVVHLFTREFGKIGALAKGARRPKSPFEGALDLLAICRVVFLPKSSDALDLLTEAKLERRFRAASRDLGRLNGAYYVAELLRELTDDDDPHPELFDAAVAAIAGLDGNDDPATTVFRFELAALRLLGHLPTLESCVGCGGEVQASGGRVAFGMLSGGVLCPKCRAGKRQVVSLSVEGRNVLQTLLGESPERRPLESVDRKIRGELRGLLGNYLSHLVGHRLKMHAYLS
jgi:DNA repair protein RecO (recombination protein O)